MALVIFYAVVFLGLWCVSGFQKAFWVTFITSAFSYLAVSGYLSP